MIFPLIDLTVIALKNCDLFKVYAAYLFSGIFEKSFKANYTSTPIVSTVFMEELGI